MLTIDELLQQSAALHHHLCPRQVLGVRMGLWAGELLNLAVPQKRKRLFTIMETDGCGADGVSTATNCWIGRRTMYLKDYGKMAATFVDTHTQQAIRLFPSLESRRLAHTFAPEAPDKWTAYLLGYQRIPAAQLFTVQRVQLHTPIEQIISRAGAKVSCGRCQEEIMNEREVVQAGQVLCRACAGDRYYVVQADSFPLPAQDYL